MISKIKSLVGLAFVLVLVLTITAASAAAQRACQDQVCSYTGACYICNAAVGQGCKVDNCGSCTNTACGHGPVAKVLPAKILPGLADAIPVSACVQPTLANMQPPVSGTQIRLPKQVNSPAKITESIHGVSDIFSGGKLENTSKQRIISYRVAWVVRYYDGKTEIAQGAHMNVPAGIDGGASTEIPDQAVSGKYFKTGAQTIDFYISEVKFQNGKGWKADLRKLQKETGISNSKVDKKI